MDTSTTQPTIALDSLVGRYFTSDHTREWHGRIVGEPVGGVYLVQRFENRIGMRLVPIDEMRAWNFYDDIELMHEDLVETRLLWANDHHRDQWEAEGTVRSSATHES